MKIPKPAKTVRAKEAYEMLGRPRSWFYNFNVNEFLSYYQEDEKHKEYIRSDVIMFGYWQMVRRGMIAMGHWGKTSSKLLPPGDTMTEKRINFEAWLIEDPHGTECPQCGGPAVQGDGIGPIWCQICGTNE